jgi:hypothetical protein
MCAPRITSFLLLQQIAGIAIDDKSPASQSTMHVSAWLGDEVFEKEKLMLHFRPCSFNPIRKGQERLRGVELITSKFLSTPWAGLNEQSLR